MCPPTRPRPPAGSELSIHNPYIHSERDAQGGSCPRRRANRDLDHLCLQCVRSERSTATPDAGTEPGAVVLIDTYYQSVFPLRQILGKIFGSHDVPSRMCPPISKLQPRCPITRCIRAAIFRSLADRVLDITREVADSPGPLPSEKNFVYAVGSSFWFWSGFWGQGDCAVG